jgi:hypothetical protein
MVELVGGIGIVFLFLLPVLGLVAIVFVLKRLKS